MHACSHVQSQRFLCSTSRNIRTLEPIIDGGGYWSHGLGSSNYIFWIHNTITPELLERFPLKTEVRLEWPFTTAGAAGWSYALFLEL